MTTAELEHEHEVAVCRAWLRSRKKLKHINPRAGSSYGLKHKVEDDMGEYVSNDAFKEAARLEGFRIEFAGRGQLPLMNPYINIEKA